MFKLTINDDDYHLSKYNEMEKTILEALAYWNNFGDHQPLKLKVEKIKDEDAIQIQTSDDIKTGERFG